MEIEKIVKEQFKEIVKSGFVEEKIKETLKTTIKSIISDCLRNYSDFGKEVKEKIKQSLSIGNMDLELPEYNQLVCNWIIEIVNNTIISTSKEEIEKNIKKFFKPLEKSEYKISEIIKEFMSDDGYSEPPDDITFIREESRNCEGYIDYYFDEDSNASKYSCKYRIGINKDGLWKLSISDTEANKMKTANLYGFDSFLFQLYASKIKIIDDYEDVETSRYYD